MTTAKLTDAQIDALTHDVRDNPSGGYLTSIEDDGGDSESADAELEDLRASLPPGWTAEWTGDGNTDDDGFTVSDVRICGPAAETPTTAADLIDLSTREGRTVTEYPSTKAEATALLEGLGAACTAEEHHSGEGYSGPESTGYYDFWGTDGEGGPWRVHVVFGALSEES
jgi:hypothetical protein